MMDLAWLSLAALLLVVTVSCTTSVNPGVLAIVCTWLIGVYLAPLWGESIGVRGVIAGFPAELFLTLAGVTWLFSQAYVNGTLPRLATQAVRLCRGNRGLAPIMFFLLALGLGTIGPGNIATAALLAPVAMAIAGRARIPPFLMVIMVAHGATASSLSPFAPAGVVVNGLMQKMEMVGYEWRMYWNNALANAVVAGGGYLAFGGWRLFAQPRDSAESEVTDWLTCDAVTGDAATDEGEGFVLRHYATLAIIGALVTGVIGFGVHVGMGAFLGAAVITIFRLADEKKTIQAMPWNVIVMVCGVSMLTALLERTGGLDLFSSLLASFATSETITGLVALVTGLISVYSSTSGVVLPTFLPSIPGLIEKLGGGDPLAIASSMAVGSHLVDTSPLSTIGALCVASVAPGENRKRLFYQVLFWGLSMSVVGALVCYVFFGLLKV